MSMTKKAPFFAKADLVGVAAAILHRLVDNVTDIAQYGQSSCDSASSNNTYPCSLKRARVFSILFPSLPIQKFIFL